MTEDGRDKREGRKKCLLIPQSQTGSRRSNLNRSGAPGRPNTEQSRILGDFLQMVLAVGGD